jgi:hypothetical protein
VFVLYHADQERERVLGTTVAVNDTQIDAKDVKVEGTGVGQRIVKTSTCMFRLRMRTRVPSLI